MSAVRFKTQLQRLSVGDAR